MDKTDANEPVFPISLNVSAKNSSSDTPHVVRLNSPLTVLIGPNGSGKTNLLRGLQYISLPVGIKKKNRFISAGRIGRLENYRAIVSDNAYSPQYDDIRFGPPVVASSRNSLETLEGDFQTLSGRPDIQIKVRERLSRFFGRDIKFSWQNGDLKVFFEYKGVSYSAGREASGILHLVGLLTAIYDDQVGILILDEPEVSLHPQLQSFLMQEIKNVLGIPDEISNKKFVFIATHSSEFIGVSEARDIANIVFTLASDKPPTQIDASAPELRSGKVIELISRMSRDHKAAFFSATPILVEGPSDEIICSGISNKLDLNLEASGAQIVPVIGKGQFPTVLKLFRLMGKRPLVLADADAFTDSNELSQSFDSDAAATALAVELSHANVRSMYRTVFADFCSLVDNEWSSIENLATKTVYWTKGDKGGAVASNSPITPAEPAIKRRRAAFSAIFQASASELDARWATMRTRLTALLDVLESAGCFILRKGAIEAYYRSDYGSDAGKPLAAAREVISFREAQANVVEAQYSDVIRCLRNACTSAPISEAEVVKLALLPLLVTKVHRARGSTQNLDSMMLSEVPGTYVLDIFGFEEDGTYITVSLKSKILNVSGFPLKIDVAGDVVAQVNSKIQ